MSYPLWLAGDPRDRSFALPVFLRDMGEGVLVGSAGAERLTDLVAEDVPVVQLYEGLPSLGPLFDPATGLATGNRALRRPMYDGDAVPAAMLDEIVAWCAGRPRVLVQCQAGLSRSSARGAWATPRRSGVRRCASSTRATSRCGRGG
jgi:hypothetical protein